jgi:hypothetical protein
MINQHLTINAAEEFIVIADEQDRSYWAARLGVSAESLKAAVRATKSLTLQHIKNYLSKGDITDESK